MTKWRALIFSGVLLTHSTSIFAGHEALERLFKNGPLPLKTEQACEPYQLALDPVKNSQTLAQDIAWVLADMSEKLINTESSCEINALGKKLCKVIFSIGEGELEWARVYQFESVQPEKGRADLKNLRCFNLP